MNSMQQFNDACKHAYSEKWKTYTKRVFKILERENPELSLLVNEHINMMDEELYDLDIVRLNIALVIQGIWPLPKISKRAADSIRDDLADVSKGPNYIWDEGRDYLLFISVDMYLSFHRHVEEVCPNRKLMIGNILGIAHILAAVVRRQKNYIYIHSEVKKILSTKPGQV